MKHDLQKISTATLLSRIVATQYSTVLHTSNFTQEVVKKVEVAEEPRSLKSQNKNQDARYKKSSSK